MVAWAFERSIRSIIDCRVGHFKIVVPIPLDSVGTKGREMAESRHLDGCLYQLERVRSGELRCKCAGENGTLHGPYWYTY